MTRNISHPVLSGLRAAYGRHGVLGQQGLVLAVSGGADSTALLIGTAELWGPFRTRLHVVTVDHQLRPESAAEAAKVAQLAERLGVSFERRVASVAPGSGVEARARTARYEALEERRAQLGLQFVVTAHTASDQAETVLMRLARGSSLRGARGIHERRQHLLRPLLSVTRAQVLSFLGMHGASFAQDSMNEDPSFQRVRVRQHLLPAYVEAAGFDPAPALARFARFAAEDEAYLTLAADAAFQRIQSGPGELERVALQALPPALRRRVLARLLTEAHIPVDAVHLDDACRIVEQEGRLTVGRHATLESRGGRVRVAHRGGADRGTEARPNAGALELRLEGPPVVMEPMGWALRLECSPTTSAESVSCRIEPCSLPLHVRTRRPGDRLIGRGRKLQDLLVDAHVPREQRGQLPLVVNAQQEVVWVPGLWPRSQAACSEKHWVLSAALLPGRQWPSWFSRCVPVERTSTCPGSPL